MFTHSHVPVAGSTIVITGAGSGIGRAFAQRLSARGSPVAIVDFNEAALANTVASLPGPVLARPMDVRDPRAHAGFAAEVKAWAPRPLGMVFNNAGVGLASFVADAAAEDDEWLHAINFQGVVLGVRAFLPLLLAQNSGAIVNTSSTFGLIGAPSQSAYAAAKFAVRGFTESLRHELRGTGVRAITVYPASVNTNIARNARIRIDPRGLGRSPEEIAADFERAALTTPERAAKIIHKGVDAGKARILVGPDAYLVDVLARVTPTRYFAVLDFIQRRAERRSARRAGRFSRSFEPAG